ncbi:MAG: response regulator [Patescibacteria group bacterium]
MSPKKKNKGKILFAEDDKFLAEMFRQKFVFEGYKPIVANTAISAVLALKKENPDIIILDIVLPDSECWMILEYLLKKKDYKPVPTILLTNWDNPEYRKKAKELKADAFIVKAYTTPKQLIKEMEKLIAKYKKAKGKKGKK